MKPKSKHLCLIDGSGFLFRAFHALPPMTRKDGTPVNAVFGFTKMVMKLIEDTNSTHMAVIFDRARKTFRSEIYANYKSNRPPPPDELIPQFQLVREATEAMNLPAIDMDGFEADDLIATYARQASEDGADVTIISSDKDLMQLVTGRVKMLDAMKSRLIGPEQVREKFGVGPEHVVDVQALAGDSVDNVPGVEGIGVKTAAQLINQYGDLDSLLDRAAEIKQPKRRERLIEQADMARLSRELVRLHDKVPVEHGWTSFEAKNFDPYTLLPFLEQQNFQSLLSTMASRLGLKSHDTRSTVDGHHTAKAKAYALIQTEKALKSWIKEASSAGVLSIDTETNNLDPLRAELVGISLALAPGQACYIPVAHKSLSEGETGDLLNDPAATKRPKQISLEKVIELLKPLLEDPGVLKIGQNIKYDKHVMEPHGIKIGPIDDTMLLSYVLDGGLRGHGMDEMATQILGLNTIKFKDVVGTGKSQVTFDYVDLQNALQYAAEDADITFQLHTVFKQRLVQEKMVTVYETLERPLVPVLQAMEHAGIQVDPEQLRLLSDDFGRRMMELEGSAFNLAGRSFNVASPKQLGEILFDEMGLPGGKKGKTGAYSTGAEILEELASTGHDLPKVVLEFRQLSKLKSTYTDALNASINPDTGRVHTSFNQAATSTGRLASADPNLQNIPIRSEEGRKIRKAFIPRKDHVLVSADYSQIELRILAHVAKITQLKQAFHNGQDIHALTASQVFDVPITNMDPMVRRNAKAINFGIVYGISAFGLARQLGISNNDAKAYIDAYFDNYPGIKDYMERTKTEARKNGYVSTLFGRKCHVKGINDRNPNIRGFAERAAINAPIQGGAADIIKRAMIRIPDELKKARLAAQMVLQVHDELIFEVPMKEVENTIEVVRSTMEGAAHLDLPLLVEIGQGLNWDEAH